MTGVLSDQYGHFYRDKENETAIGRGKSSQDEVVNHFRSDSQHSNNFSLLEIYQSVPIIEPIEGGSKGKDDLLTREEEEGIEFKKEDSEAMKNLKKPVSLNNEKFVTNIKPISKSTIKELQESAFDRYGFKKDSSLYNVTRDEYDKWYAEYLQYCMKRKKKWLILMKSNGLSSELSNEKSMRFPARSDKVKKMIRKGIPSEWRGSAWFFYAGGYEKLNKNIGVYDKIVEDTRGINNSNTEIIERDLNRTFPDNIHFNKRVHLEQNNDLDETETPAITSLRRILVAFAHFQPQVGYCQSLNFLAGLLLLFMEEEKAFWMLVILTERIIPKVHSKDLEGVHTDQGVLMLCIKEYIPHVWSYIGRGFDGTMLNNDNILSRLPPVTLVTSSWFMSLYIGTLPIETVLRVWDILWYEGSKTIFRISLTLCNICFDSPIFTNKNLSNSTGGEVEQIELFQLMQTYPKSIIDANMLIDSCFKKIGGYGFGFLSQEEINRCREFVSKQKRLLSKRKAISTEMSEEERRTLLSSGSQVELDENQIHDVYGFHKSLMNGVIWNKHISSKMKKRLAKKP